VATPAGCLHLWAAADHDLFLIAVPFAMLALVGMPFILPLPLRATIQRLDGPVMDGDGVPVGVAR
jgi:hypothetical protein